MSNPDLLSLTKAQVFATPKKERLAMTNYDEAKVSPYTLPELLRMTDGRMVTDKEMWQERRKEILDILQKNIYGKIIPAPDHLHFELLSRKEDALNNTAIRKEIRIWAGMENGRSFHFDLLMYIPKNTSTPPPVFAGLNFQGNHACTNEEDVRITAVRRPGHPENQFARGNQNDRWDFAECVRRGYASITANYHDIMPDMPNRWDKGALNLFKEGLSLHYGPLEEYSAIGVWAWGLSRIADYLEQDKEVNADKIILHGHSRLGKTSLWAGGIDERFKMVISNDSGCCGAALTRRNFGETIATIAGPENPSYWFVKGFAEFMGRLDEMPFDQHFLLALAAPRPLAVASATLDQWADPRGEFLSCVSVAPVYNLFGFAGLGTGEMPAPGKGIYNIVSYHIREGKHDQTPLDWEVYMDLADKYIKG
ncbi:MAG: acetylxylan esterase [Lentisphaeria bacterium]|nr:acetylxylan esterase [Lentisphaeria bacterium]